MMKELYSLLDQSYLDSIETENAPLFLAFWEGKQHNNSRNSQRYMHPKYISLNCPL